MSSTPTTTPLLPLNRNRTRQQCKNALNGLPSAMTDLDSSRLVLVFYCLGGFDLLGTTDTIPDREDYRAWIWEQYAEGKYGAGFRPGPFMNLQGGNSPARSTDYDTPHIITTYAGLLSLAILRDDLSRIDRPGILKFLRFSIVPESNETDLRTLYCAFAISSMLNDWSGVDIQRAVRFIEQCRTYEGGYGQSPFCEAQGGTTYTAIAALGLAEQARPGTQYLTVTQRQRTIEWLLSNQDPSGGFCGRTGKDADACYCFWCGASLKILRAGDFVDSRALIHFLSHCQSAFGGIAKAPGEPSDPYHTYLSLAAISLYPPPKLPIDSDSNFESWMLKPLDPLLNATQDTAKWARQHLDPGSSR